ncbi:MAG: T9SS type A sorting domain-containing protein [Bacteroidota bacterium]
MNLGYLPVNISVSNNIAYVCLYDGGFAIIDVSNPKLPTLLSNIKAPHARLGPIEHKVQSSFVFISTVLGFWIVNISELSSPKSDFFYATAYDVIDAKVEDNIAYVNCSFGGLRILDITTRDKPEKIGDYITPEILYDFEIKDSIGYLLTEKKIIVLNVANPTHPSLISEVSISDNTPRTEGVSIKLIDKNGSLFLFTIHSENVLKIFEVSNPANINLIQTLELDLLPYSIDVSEDYLFVGYYERLIEIYLISDLPNAITKITNIDNQESVNGLFVNNEFIYVADVGLTIYNIGDINNPTRVGHIDTPGSRSKVDIEKEGDTLYLSYWYNLEVIDITDKHNPKIIAYFRDIPINGVAANNKNILLSVGRKGLLFLENDHITNSLEELPIEQNTSMIILYQNYPNPFNSYSKIRFELKKQSNVKILVFNTLGEMIQKLVNGIYTSGVHSVVFNSSHLPSGIYYYSLISEGQVIVKKMLLMK